MKQNVGKAVKIAVLTVGALVMIFPFLWMLFTLSLIHISSSTGMSSSWRTIPRWTSTWRRSPTSSRRRSSRPGCWKATVWTAAPRMRSVPWPPRFGSTLRLISDIPGVKYTEGRFLPYFFPEYKKYRIIQDREYISDFDELLKETKQLQGKQEI